MTMVKLYEADLLPPHNMERELLSWQTKCKTMLMISPRRQNLYIATAN